MSLEEIQDSSSSDGEIFSQEQNISPSLADGQEIQSPNLEAKTEDLPKGDFKQKNPTETENKFESQDFRVNQIDIDLYEEVLEILNI